MLPVLALGVLIFTMAMLGVVQAQGSPSIDISKERDQMIIRGTSATFTIAITNTGDVTLTNVTVSDTQAPNCARAAGSLPDLVPGGHTSYACTRAHVMTDFTNSATVAGTDVLSATVVTDSDTAFVDVVEPAIAIAKMPDTQALLSGASAHFDITVTNTGDVTLTNVNVSDALAPNCDRPVGSLPDLAPGADTSYACTVANVTSGFTNSATATGTPPVGDDVTATDEADVDVVAPAIGIAKTPDTQSVASGSSATFAIAVTNNGDSTLTNVTVSDAQAPDCNRTFSALAAGENESYSCAVANVTDGFINSASVTGTPLAGGNVTDTDAAKVRLDTTQPCPGDTIAYWRLDETGGTHYDDFYYGHDGECAGQCPTPTTSGHINGGQAFNGSNTGIDVPLVPGDHSFDWGVDDSFAIEFWMQGDSACSENNEVIVGRDDSSTSLHWWAGCRVGGQAAFYLRDTGGTIEGVIGTSDLTDGTWHHIVAVRDASSDVIRIYIDGTEEDSESAIYSAGFGSTTAELNVGWLDLSHGYHFEGTIDEVALYDRALSTDEIRQHYNEGLAGRWYCEGGTFAPVIVSTPVTEANAGRMYNYDVEAAGNPVPTYTLATAPNGMTIDTATGLISWTPTVAQVGDHDVEVVAGNSEGTDTQNYAISVAEGTLCPTDMLAFWKLDETSGTTYGDFYNGHDGHCAGVCPVPASGRLNGGQAFDGSSTGIDVPADQDFDWGLTDSFSIAFWMQTDSASTCAGNEVIIGRDDSTTDLHWWAGCSDGGLATFYLVDKSGTTASVTGGTVTDGAWHHVVAIRDADENEIRIYVDGATGNPTAVTYTDSFDSSTAALNIGWIDLSSGFHRFDGIVDEVALYDRALSTAEIQQQYDDGLAGGPGYCINPDIAVSKTADSSAVYQGNTVLYTYTATNPGDAPLSDVALSDEKCSPVSSPTGDTDGDAKLDPIETWTYHCSMTVSADITNTVTITGTYHLGGTVNDADMLFVDAISPQIDVEKTAHPTSIDSGESVTYTYIVTNLGDDPLSEVNVTDDKCGPVTTLEENEDISNYTLDPGEAWTYTCLTPLYADTTNTATAVATDSAGGTASDTDTAFVDVVDSYPIYLPMVLKN
jgi:uncharacterized repeat protein (TIGR01451 family)